MISPGVHLPAEGWLPSFSGATAWLNSDPLTPEGLRGKVIVADFCTYTCINWLRSLPYVRAWDERYRSDGLVTIGIHTPEFSFERDLDNIRPALEEMRVTYPVVVDNDYGVWNASRTTTGRRCTSSTPRDASGTIASAKAITSARRS